MKKITNNVVTTQPLVNIVQIGLWTLVLVFLAELFLAFSFAFIYRVLQGSNYSSDVFDSLIVSIPVLLSFGLFSPLINIPLLLRATPHKKWLGHFEFWAIKEIKKKELFQWLLLALSYWVILALLDATLNFPVEPFMLDIKNATDSIYVLALVIVNICIIGPIMEEVIFRGWMFSKIAQTKLSKIGALLITSVVFTIIHSQYVHSYTFYMIFSLALLLGFIRYKSNNITYTIIIHILFNTEAIFSLFLV